MRYTVSTATERHIMTTVYTYSNGIKFATTVTTVTADNGDKLEVVEQAGRFFIKRNGTQTGPDYGSKEPAIIKVQAVAYLGELL